MVIRWLLDELSLISYYFNRGWLILDALLVHRISHETVENGERNEEDMVNRWLIYLIYYCI